ncbi:unnamed protein product, partial [Durusdinium trenchii]
ISTMPWRPPPVSRRDRRSSGWWRWSWRSFGTSARICLRRSARSWRSLGVGGGSWEAKKTRSWTSSAASCASRPSRTST